MFSKLFSNQKTETMKKFTLLSVLFAVLTTMAFAGGMVHNTNQSAAWIRMLVRDASVDVDAVYYNPAGLTKLPDGFHIQVNNQTIIQSRKIENTYPKNNTEYIGDVFVPALPTAFLVYKMNKIALSAGFTVIGGGGSANYKEGLPSFEIPISDIPALLTANGIPTTKYYTDIKFDGSSVYYGVQVGVTYAINDMLSVALGGRYVMAKNTYEGSISNIQINPNMQTFGANFNGVNMVSAPTFFQTGATVFNQLAGTAASLQPVIDGGDSGLTMAQAGFSDAQIAAITGGFALINPSIDPATLTIAQIQGAYQQATSLFQEKEVAMTGYKNLTSDVNVDVEQNGSTFTPIIGVNLSLLEEKLNIGLKYELKSTMDVKNKTAVDGSGMFPNDEKVPSDIPAMFTCGISYKLTDNFSTSFGMHYYWDKSVSYGKKMLNTTTQQMEYVKNDKVIDDNTYEAALGLQYNVSPKIALSAGYLYAKTSPALNYQSDLSYSLLSHSIGFGGNMAITEKMNIDLGFLYTAYEKGEKEISYGANTYKETYYKDNMVFSIGLTYSFCAAK